MNTMLSYSYLGFDRANHSLFARMSIGVVTVQHNVGQCRALPVGLLVFHRTLPF